MKNYQPISNKCTFCSQFKLKKQNNLTSIIFGKNFNRILYEDDFFVVIPALGQIVEGYLIIVPKDHYDSISRIPKELYETFLCLKEKIFIAISKEYTEPIFFEHGSFADSNLGGGCINHGHIHVVPANVDITDVLATTFDLFTINGIEALWKLKPNSAYLYYENEHSDAYYTPVYKLLPCQYFRRLIAQGIGKPHIWNWHYYIGKKELISTVNRLKGKIS
jgi:ATP adenylyltransferase